MDGIITYLCAGLINNNFSAISGAEIQQPMTKRLKIIVKLWLASPFPADSSNLFYSHFFSYSNCFVSKFRVVELSRLAANFWKYSVVDLVVALVREISKIINHHYLDPTPANLKFPSLLIPAQLTNFPEHQRKQKPYFQIKL